jgi:hypothetical protein
MADEIHHEDDRPMHRSASSLIFQSMTSAGQLAAGIGALGVGAAAVKGKFGGSPEPHEEPQQPKKDSE